MEGTSREESFALLKKLLRSLKYQSYDMRIIGAISRSRKEFPEFKKLLPEIFDTMIPLDLPSLEERKDDIPVLVEVFLEQFNRKLKESQKKPKQLIDSLSIYRLLQLRGWQDGNITRLRMVVEAVLFKTPKLLITAEDFTAAFDTSAEQSVSEVIEALPATAKERSVKRKKISPVGVYKHDIGLSYSIEDQNRARALAEALHRHGVDVFFDEYERATLWGEDLVTYMSELYQSDVRYCVMLLSEHYAKKPPYEHRVASARALKGVHILPICLDKTKIPSHLETINPLDWNKETTESIADKVVQKLYGQPSPTPPANTSGTARKKRTKQMHFLGQQPGETIKTVVRRHWLFLASPTLPLIGSIAIFLFLWFWGRSTSPLFHILWMIFEVGTVFLIFCSAIYFYYRGLNRWWKEINIITDKRIITWSSNFSDVNRQETPVVNVQQIAVERESFLGALLNYGTVYVYVRDGELIMKNVPDPNSVLNDIQSAKKRLAAKKARQREQTVL